MKRKTLALAISLLLGSAGTQAITLENPGFEDGMDGWTEKDPASISSDEYSGSKSLKISDSPGRVHQVVDIERNTDYILSAFVKGNGRIGINGGGSLYKATAFETNSWERVSLSFNSGSLTSTQIFAKFGKNTDDDVRFDDFSLVRSGSSNPIVQVPPTVEVTPSPSGACNISDLALSASDDGSNDGHSPSLAVDGDRSDSDSRWSSNGEGKWIQFDLGGTTTLDRIDTAWYKGNQRTSFFDVSTSINGRDWTTAVSGGQSQDTTNFGSNDLGDVSARYVRIEGNGNSSSSWNSLLEAKVFGCDDFDNNAPTPTPVQTPTPSPTPAQTPPPTSTPDAPTGSSPSDFFVNCNQWKITWVDASEEKQLCGQGERRGEYEVSANGDALIFTVPMNDGLGRTSSATKYSRSELREREEDGSRDVYWDTDGSSALYIQQAITHLPIEKDHLVAGQIHGNKSEGIDDSMVVRLEGQHLFLSFNGGKLRDNVTIKNNYRLGTKFEVIFEVIDGKHYAYYSEDGNLRAAYNNGNARNFHVRDGSDTVLLDIDYGDAYFKVGNYTQSNEDTEGSSFGRDDNYGEVYVYAFNVNHEGGNL